MGNYDNPTDDRGILSTAQVKNLRLEFWESKVLVIDLRKTMEKMGFTRLWLSNRLTDLQI